MRRLCIGLFAAFAIVPALPAATVDGIPIHYSTHGEGPATLVFVHGWTCDETSWAGQVGPFAERYRAVTLDLPGHGQSGAPADDAFSIDLFADAVEAVRAEVGADEVVLIGHSMGVPVIRQYARHYPENVAGLVPVDGPLSAAAFAAMAGGEQGELPPMPEVGGADGLEARETMIRGMFTDQTPASVQEDVLEMMLSAPEATAVGAMQAMGDPAVWSEAVIPMPVLAVYAGTADPPEAEVMRRTAPNYEATQIAGTGHFVMMEQPAEFNELLSGFLNGIGF